METPRIFTVFEFRPATPEGIINYSRHLVAGVSHAQARAAILARALLTAGNKAYMTTDESAEACRTEVMMSAHMDRDSQGLTERDMKAWLMIHTVKTIEDGQEIPPSHMRIW